MDYYRQQVIYDLNNYADESDYKGRTAEEVRELAMLDDSITGNASGSYYCNRYAAEEDISSSRILFCDEFVSALEDYGYSALYSA